MKNPGTIEDPSVFADLETFAMFLGYPRSGHSLIGALLDAHPDIVMAHELDVLGYVAEGCGREEIFTRLLDNSRAAREGGRVWGDYSYAVPGQWQGRFRKLRVIGDKKGGGSLRWLRSNPELLERLRQTVGLGVKFLHVLRNPYDTIGSMVRHRAAHGGPLEKCIETYFTRCRTFAAVKPRIASRDLLEIRYESFVAEPRAHLQELCRFLGVDAPDDYLSACVSIVHTSPHRSRHQVPWTEQQIGAVRELMSEFPFLRGYIYSP